MPALHIKTSRRWDSERNLFAVCLTESRLVRSHSRKVNLAFGETSLILEINSLALEVFRPLKKICAGVFSAIKEMNPAPRPVVPKIRN